MYIFSGKPGNGEKAIWSIETLVCNVYNKHKFYLLNANQLH